MTKMDNKEIIAENAKEVRKPDGDLQSAFQYNPQTELNIEDIEDVRAAVYGENDGCCWYWLVKLVRRGSPMANEVVEPKYALLEGGCDYTGWDCQSHLSVLKIGSFHECITAAPITDGYDRNIVQTLSDQVANKLPFGVIQRG